MEDVKDDLKRAVEILRSGGVILYPADSGWGLGCDATNKNAVEKIVRIKKSEAKNTMIVLLDNASRLQAYVNEVPDMAWDLIDLTEKPLTILFENAKNLPDNVVSVDKSVAIRVTNEYFSNSLCSRFRKCDFIYSGSCKRGARAGELFGNKRRNKIGCRLHSCISTR